MLAEAPRSREAYVERIVKTFGVIGSPAYPADPRAAARHCGPDVRPLAHPRGILRQMHAITASGNRPPALRRLRLPVAVIHGSRDPLIRPSGGRATARAIPGARLRMIEGMGHDLPRELWRTFADDISDTAARAPAPARAKQPA